MRSLEAGIDAIDVNMYNAVIEYLKSKMGRPDLNMTTVKDWLPGQTTGLKVSNLIVCSNLKFTVNRHLLVAF